MISRKKHLDDPLGSNFIVEKCNGKEEFFVLFKKKSQDIYSFCILFLYNYYYQLTTSLVKEEEEKKNLLSEKKNHFSHFLKCM